MWWNRTFPTLDAQDAQWVRIRRTLEASSAPVAGGGAAHWRRERLEVTGRATQLLVSSARLLNSSRELLDGKG